MVSGMRTAASAVNQLAKGLPNVATAMQTIGPAATASSSGIRSFGTGDSNKWHPQ